MILPFSSIFILSLSMRIPQIFGIIQFANEAYGKNMATKKNHTRLYDSEWPLFGERGKDSTDLTILTILFGVYS